MALMGRNMTLVLLAAVFYGSKYVSASAGHSLFSSIQLGFQIEKDVSEAIVNAQASNLVPDMLEDLGINEIFGEAFTTSGMMIILSELGDKTFIIAALLAMKHPRSAVFLGCWGALALQTLISATMGLALPSLLSRELTHWAAVALFVFFGLRNSHEAFERFMTKSEDLDEFDGGSLDEAENDMEDSVAENRSITIQAFTMTFLAEWGDRSQIATIALAGTKNPIGVALGGIAGHCCCTALAVVGGKVLAGQISERCILAAGGALFLGFAAQGYYVGPALD